MDGKFQPVAEQSGRPRGGRLYRYLPLAALLVILGLVLAMGWYRHLSLETLVHYRDSINALIARHWLGAVAAFVALYAGVVGLSVPGATILTIAGGILFGAAIGGVAAVIGATAGATIIFLIARTAFGERLVRRAGPLAERFAAGFRADGFNYLLFLRLVPAFPFFLVNLAAALVGLRLSTFVAATAVGIVPATFAFAFFGAGLQSVMIAQESTYRACVTAGGDHCRLDFSLTKAVTPELLAALVMLGVVALIPVLVKRLRARSRLPDQRPS